MDRNKWISCEDSHPECDEHGMSEEVHVQVRLASDEQVIEARGRYNDSTKCWSSGGSIKPFDIIGQVIAWRPVTEEDGDVETDEPKITEEQYNALVDARNTLCNYCENDACENCIVTLLLDQAYVEAEAAGIVEDY